jgi:hypothetical protein
MKKKVFPIGLFILFIFSFFCSVILIVNAFDSTSTNFQIRAGDIESIVGTATSSNFQNRSGGGQTAVGFSTSTNRRIYSGILYWLFPDLSSNLTQIHYRWRTDNGNEASANFAENEDTELKGVKKNIIKRLRFEISNEGTALESVQFKIQYAETSSCANGSYVDIPTSTSLHWQITDSTRLTDGATTSNVTVNGGLTDENTNFVAGVTKDTGNLTSAINLTSSNFTEIEYSLKATNNATDGGTYCFRLVRGDGSTLDTYSVYARIKIHDPVPPDFTLSAYRFFNNLNATSVDSPLASQDTAATLTSSGQNFRLRLLLHTSNKDAELNLATTSVKSATLPAGTFGLSCAENSSTHKIYCFGGQDDSTSTSRIFEYDPANNTTTVKSATLPAPNIYLSCAENSATNRIYCFGGNTNNGITSTIVEYNPSSDTTTIKSATLPSARKKLACVENSSNNRIYCFGGEDSSNFINQVVEYNPSSDTTTVKSATMPSSAGKSSFSCAEDSSTHKIYCFGGSGASPDFQANTIFEYNLSSDSITVKSAKLPAGTYGLSCAEDSSTHKIYCFGGDTAGDFASEILYQINEYDPSNDTRTTKNAVLPSSRYLFSCVQESLKNTIYCFGGYNGNPFNEIVEYAKFFKLQFSERGGVCDTNFSGENYADITSSSLIAYKDNLTPKDGESLSATSTDPTHGGDTVVTQSYEEKNNFTNNVNQISAGSDGKWDFSLTDNSAPGNTNYCLRVVKSDGSQISGYNVIPEIKTAASASISCSLSSTSTTFSSLSPSSVSTSTPDLTITISATSSSGMTLFVKDNGDNSSPGLYKSTSPTHLINSSDATLAAGTDGYGIQSATTTAGSGATLSLNSKYNKTGNDVGGLSLTNISVASSSSSFTGREVVIKHKAAVSNLSPIGDYTDTITYTCSAN